MASGNEAALCNNYAIAFAITAVRTNKGVFAIAFAITATWTNEGVFLVPAFVPALSSANGVALVVVVVRSLFCSFIVVVFFECTVVAKI